jgi:hypothetical protein
VHRWRAKTGGDTLGVGLKTDRNSWKNTYPIFTFILFNRMETKMNGAYSVCRKGTNLDGDIRKTVGKQ